MALSAVLKVLKHGLISEENPDAAEAMRTYLFQFAAQYNSVSLDVISSMFDLERKQAYGLVSKMIINEELHGMCDEPSASVVMAHVEPTRLQTLAMTFAVPPLKLPMGVPLHRIKIGCSSSSSLRCAVMLMAAVPRSIFEIFFFKISHRA